MKTKRSSESLSSVSKCFRMNGSGPSEYGGAASIVGEYWVTLVVWLLEEHWARAWLVGSSLTSS